MWSCAPDPEVKVSEAPDCVAQLGCEGLPSLAQLPHTDQHYVLSRLNTTIRPSEFAKLKQGPRVRTVTEFGKFGMLTPEARAECDRISDLARNQDCPPALLHGTKAGQRPDPEQTESLLMHAIRFAPTHVITEGTGGWSEECLDKRLGELGLSTDKPSISGYMVRVWHSSALK